MINNTILPRIKQFEGIGELIFYIHVEQLQFDLTNCYPPTKKKIKRRTLLL